MYKAWLYDYRGEQREPLMIDRKWINLIKKYKDNNIAFRLIKEIRDNWIVGQRTTVIAEKVKLLNALKDLKELDENVKL